MADRDDDPGVLGNLPRSRPGTRSSKRNTGGTAAKRQPAAGATGRRASTAARTSATGGKKASGTRGTKARKPAATAGSSQSRSATPPPRRQPAQQPDPVTQAVRLAGKVAETGVKTAVGILRRLPGGGR
jgi:hypothetical protein